MLCCCCCFLYSALVVQESDAETFPPNAQFRVVVAVPLTGNAADYGEAIRNSIELAQSDRPERFTRTKFFVEDTPAGTTQTVTSFRAIAERYQPHIVVTWGIASCKMLAPIAESLHLPLIGLCIDPETAKGRKYVMRFMNTTDDYMKLNAEHLARQHKRRIALLVSDFPYLAEMRAAFERTAPQGLTLTLLDNIPNNESDFRSYIMRLKQERYDAVGVFLFMGQVSTFYLQAKQLGLTTPTFGTNIFESTTEVRNAQGAMNGAEFAGARIRPDFIQRYRERFGNENQITFGAPAYEMALAIGKLFNDESTPPSADQILERFRPLSDEGGQAAGPYQFVDSPSVGKYVEFPLTMKRIVGEEFVPY